MEYQSFDRFEYKFERITYNPIVKLNELGNDGWELIQISNNDTYILKRKLMCIITD